MDRIDEIKAYLPELEIDSLKKTEYEWGTIFSNGASLPEFDVERAGTNNVIVATGPVAGRVMFRGSRNLCILAGAAEKPCQARVYFWGSDSTFVFGQGSTSNGLSVEFNNRDRVVVGNDCMFSDNIILRTNDRHAVLDEHGSIINASQPITIGDHVWVGQRAMIMKGVNIGSGSIVAAGAVVTKSIPPACAVGGNPAQILKKRIGWTRSPNPGLEERMEALRHMQDEGQN